MKGVILAYGYTVLAMMLISLFLFLIVFKQDYQQKRYQYRNALEILISEMKPDKPLEAAFVDLINDRQGQVIEIKDHYYPKLLRVAFKTKIMGIPVVFDELMIEEGL